VILSEPEDIILSVVKSMIELIRRQVNDVAHVLAKAALFLASFRIFNDIPTCNHDILINQMLYAIYY